MREAATLAMALCLASITGKEPGEPAPAGAAERQGIQLTHHSGVVGGVHDFSEGPDGLGDACRACHVPHVQGIRTTTQPATSQPAFEIFRIGGQRRVFVPDRYMPGPTSLLCLGCHDGTVASSTIGSSHALLAGVREGFTMPDGFVWRDHPIGVPYPNEPNEYHPESFAVMRGIRLPEGRIECVSCHDPPDIDARRHAVILPGARRATGEDRLADSSEYRLRRR